MRSVVWSSGMILSLLLPLAMSASLPGEMAVQKNLMMEDVRPNQVKSSTSILYKDKGERRMVEVVLAQLASGKEYLADCFIIGDRDVGEEFLSSFPPSRTVVLETPQLEDVLNDCSALLLSHLTEGNLHSFTDNNVTRGGLRRGFFDGLLIFPGTKWCGAGNIASDYNDLGLAKEADMCCRTHDHCEDNIEAGEKKYGLENKAIYTKSHCECDRRFYSCLRTHQKLVPTTVGSIYFNLLQAQCFAYTHPITKCLEYSGWIPWIYWSCQKYQFDTTKPKLWQFLDAKKF